LLLASLKGREFWKPGLIVSSRRHQPPFAFVRGVQTSRNHWNAFAVNLGMSYSRSVFRFAPRGRLLLIDVASYQISVLMSCPLQSLIVAKEMTLVPSPSHKLAIRYIFS